MLSIIIAWHARCGNSQHLCVYRMRRTRSILSFLLKMPCLPHTKVRIPVRVRAWRDGLIVTRRGLLLLSDNLFITNFTFWARIASHASDK